MKLKYNLIFGLAGALTLSSCDDLGDSMLTQNNPNELTAGIFWRNLTDCNKGLTAVYRTFSNQNVLLTGDDSNRSDLTWPGVWPAWTTTNEFYNHTYNDATKSSGSKWATLYEGIFRANQVIVGLEGIKANMKTEDELREWELIMGQARFFRGLFHHYLNKSFNKGNVPIMNSVPANESEFLVPCNESEDVKAFYREDLKYAESVLPVKGNSDDWSRETGTMGRITSGAASTVLGVSYLYDKDYATAKTYFEKLISNPSYALTNKYNDNFSSLTEFNSESILEINYTLDYNADYTLWDAKHMSNTLALTFAPGTVGGWGPTIIPSYWLQRDYIHEPVDRLNPDNKVMIKTDIHGDLLYYNTKSVKETKAGGKTFHEYPVIPNPQHDLMRDKGAMTYYLKKVEVDASGVPVIKDLTTLPKPELNKIYKGVSPNPTLPARAYTGLMNRDGIEFTKDDGTKIKQQFGEVMEVFYDEANNPYRYKIHSDRASSSVITYTEQDVPYYKNPQPFIVWGFSNAVGAFRKFTNWDICAKEKDISPLVRSAMNVRVLRLSDVYLMYAECLIEGGAKDAGVSEAIKYINRVRKRAGTVLIGKESVAGAEYVGDATYQDTPDPEGTSRSYVNLYNRKGEDKVIETAADVMNHLMYKERPLELSLEGHAIRFNDLRRWGITKQRFENLSKQAYSTWAFFMYSLKDKTVKSGWTWSVDYDPKNFIGKQPKYQYVDAAANYSEDKAYYPIPSDEALANPEIGNVVKVQ